MLNTIIFGAPGSGKGTQANKLVKLFNVCHISTGELLRDEMKNGTKLGIKFKDIINSGEYVPDEDISKLLTIKVEELLKINTNGFIFDGYPRTLAQCDILNKIVQSFNSKIDVLINLDVADNILIERLLERGESSNREEDKNKEAISTRLNLYNNETKPLLEYYNDIVININGEGTVEEIHNQIIKNFNI